MTYQVWLFSIAGDKIAYLQNALGISRTERSNEAPTLLFSLPADDPKGAYLTSAYQVKIWNTIKNRFEGLYDIDDATDESGISMGSANMMACGC